MIVNSSVLLVVVTSAVFGLILGFLKQKPFPTKWILSGSLLLTLIMSVILKYTYDGPEQRVSDIPLDIITGMIIYIVTVTTTSVVWVLFQSLRNILTKGDTSIKPK